MNWLIGILMAFPLSLSLLISPWEVATGEALSSLNYWPATPCLVHFLRVFPPTPQPQALFAPRRVLLHVQIITQRGTAILPYILSPFVIWAKIQTRKKTKQKVNPIRGYIYLCYRRLTTKIKLLYHLPWRNNKASFGLLSSTWAINWEAIDSFRYRS